MSHSCDEREPYSKMNPSNCSTKDLASTSPRLRSRSRTPSTPTSNSLVTSSEAAASLPIRHSSMAGAAEATPPQPPINRTPSVESSNRPSVSSRNPVTIDDSYIISMCLRRKSAVYSSLTRFEYATSSWSDIAE